MELILKKDVDKLGYKDDIVKVCDGYGCNYLILKGYVVIVNEVVKKNVCRKFKVIDILNTSFFKTTIFFFNDLNTN